MALDEATWAEIERLYVDSDETVDAIARRFGTSSRKIYKRVKLKGLPLRGGRSRRPVGRAGPALPVPPGDPTRAARDALISRLYRALSRKIKHLEDRMTTTDGADPEISEQQTRELNSAVSAFEKVTEVHTDADKVRAAAERAAAPVTRADLERLRRDLAERLHRVWGNRKR